MVFVMRSHRWGIVVSIRRAVVFAALILPLVLAAVAESSHPSSGVLKGPVDAGGRAKLEISYSRMQGHRYRTYKWRIREVRVKCEHLGARTYGSTIQGGNTVWNRYADRGPFGVVAGDPGGSEVSKVSFILRDADKATGYVRVHGTNVHLAGGGHDSCDSGRLHWVVRRAG